MNRLCVVMVVVLLAPALGWAQDVPTAVEIKKVQDYMENGKDKGPVLMEVVACLNVDNKKGSATAFDCIEPVNGPVKKGTMVHVWTSWALPKGGKYEDITVQWLHEGSVRSTSDIAFEGSEKWSNPRARTWKSSNMSKTGKWEMKVQREGKELGSVSVTVE